MLAISLISTSLGYSTAAEISSEQVSFLAEDGVQLTGRLDRNILSGAIGVGVILVHGGFAGSIDTDKFVVRAPALFASKGFAVLSPNMRRGKSFTTSVFEDSVKDIQAAIRFMTDRGFTRVFLAGHSNGANEATYFLEQTRDKAVIALGLYAAASAFKFSVRNFLGDESYSRITQQATDLVAKGGRSEIVYGGPVLAPGPSAPPPVSISAQTWLSWFGPNSKLDTSISIRSVEIPVLIVVHEEDGRLVSWSERYRSNAIVSVKADLRIYRTATTGNPHYFEGLEEQVVRDTVDWLLALTLAPKLTTYSVKRDAKTYDVTIVSNSVISNLDFNQPLEQIAFSVSGDPKVKGFANVTIPKELLGGPFFVKADENILTYDVKEAETTFSLHFTYSHDVRSIKIIGTTAAAPPGRPVPRIIVTVSTERLQVGDVIAIARRIEPTPKEAGLVLIYTSPSGSISRKSVAVAQDGSFNDRLVPNEIGTWRVSASWEGDQEYKSSTSAEYTFRVEGRPVEAEGKTTATGVPTKELDRETKPLPLDVFPVIGVVAVIGISLAILLLRKAKKPRTG